MNDFSFADIFTLSMSPLRVLITLLLALAVGGFMPGGRRMQADWFRET